MPIAQFTLAYRYARGLGLTQDYKEAEAWWARLDIGES
jgi:TPR repeat protein